MKKNNTKVELKKYLSQKEKIKNTFISSCIILVVLTFFIFITYSYFIKDSGEINVGDTYAAIPEYDVEIINKELVDNTNGQQAVITIYNYSNTNTYSYNLGYYYNAGGACNPINVYYKIPSEEYSHPEGIIKPNEEKKIYLVSNNICRGESTLIDENSPVELKLNSGYEYTPSLLEYPYEKIEYSPLESTTELINMEVLDSDIDIFPNVAYNIDTEDEYYLFGEGVGFTLYNNGNVTINKNRSYPTDNNYVECGILDDFNNSNKSKIAKTNIIDIYAEDGTYIETYYLKTGPSALSKFVFSQRFPTSNSTLKQLSSNSGITNTINITGYNTSTVRDFIDVEYVNTKNGGFDDSKTGGSIRFALSFNNSPNCYSSPINELNINPNQVKVRATNYLYIGICDAGTLKGTVTYDITIY